MLNINYCSIDNNNNTKVAINLYQMVQGTNDKQSN